MGRSCTELWTNVHFVLKAVAVILIVIVECLVLGWSPNNYWQIALLDGYYLVALTVLIIILYGYTWFESTIVLESCMTIVAILVLLFSVIAVAQKRYDDAYRVSKYQLIVTPGNRDAFATFVGLTSVSIVVLVIDLILLLLRATGKMGG